MSEFEQEGLCVFLGVFNLVDTVIDRSRSTIEGELIWAREFHFQMLCESLLR